MKKTWINPRIEVQQFVPNEYVAACYSLYCLISGNGTTFTGNRYHDRGEGPGYDATTEWEGLSTPLDQKLHGSPCANGSSLDDETGIYYEDHKKSAVGNIVIGGSAGNGRSYAVWTSEDVNGTGTYNHYGYAVEDSSNPNHS